MLRKCINNVGETRKQRLFVDRRTRVRRIRRVIHRSTIVLRPIGQLGRALLLAKLPEVYAPSFRSVTVPGFKRFTLRPTVSPRPLEITVILIKTRISK